MPAPGHVLRVQQPLILPVEAVKTLIPWWPFQSQTTSFAQTSMERAIHSVLMDASLFRAGQPQKARAHDLHFLR